MRARAVLIDLLPPRLSLLLIFSADMLFRQDC